MPAAVSGWWVAGTKPVRSMPAPAAAGSTPGAPSCRSPDHGTRSSDAGAGVGRATRSSPTGPSASRLGIECRGPGRARGRLPEKRQLRCSRRSIPATSWRSSRLECRGPQWRGHGLGRRPRTQHSTTDPACRDQAELARRAISSAVEHLPYKEIVTGSIPVSPTRHGKAFQPTTTCHSAGFLLRCPRRVHVADQMHAGGKRLVEQGYGASDPEFESWLVELWKQK